MSDHISETVSLGSEGGDPSMEDILASIRRIIADDTDANVDNAPDHVDLRDLAATPPIHADDNAVLVTPDAGSDAGGDIDLDDILIMDDDDFAADDLEIPSAEIFGDETSTGTEAFLVDETSETPQDDLEAEIAAMLKKRDASQAVSPSILPEADVPETGADGASEMLVDVMDLLESSSPTSNPAIVELQSADKNPVAELSNTEDLSSDLSDDDIFSALDLDMDLVLDSAEDFAIELETTEPNSETAFGSETDILGLIDDGISELPTPSVVPVEPEAPSVDPVFDASSGQEMPGSDDNLMDLVGSLLDESQPETPAENANVDLVGIEVPEPAVDDLVQMDAITPASDVAGESDIDLVKSLMAELTDEPLHDDIDVVPAASSPEPTPNLPEAQLVDDILELTIEDQTSESGNLNSGLEPAPEAELTDANSIDSIFSDEIFSNPPEFDELEVESVALDIVEPDLNVAERSLPDVSLESLDHEPDAKSAPTAEPSEPVSILDIAAAAEMDAVAPLETADNVRTEEPTEALGLQDLESLDDDLVAVSKPDNSDGARTEAPLEIDSIFAEALTFDDVESADDVSETVAAVETQSGGADKLDDLIDFSALPALPDVNAGDAISAEADGEIDLSSIFDDELEPVIEEAIFESPLSASAIVAENLVPEMMDPRLTENALGANTDDITADIIDIEDDQAPEQETEEMPKLVTKDGILDDITESASAEAFASLNQLVEEKTEYEESGPRIGDLVQDALRPMLKEWLDANLKGIVERAVTKEVKRISSGK